MFRKENVRDMRCLHVFNYFEMEERFLLFKRKRLLGQVLLQFFHIFINLLHKLIFTKPRSGGDLDCCPGSHDWVP